jgi:hypothetical protein
MRFGTRKLGVCAGIAALSFLPMAAWAQPATHVIIVSIDGLHEADLTDPALVGDIPKIHDLLQSSVFYTQASATTPSDSFPAAMAYITGAGPATTGIYYDESYSRTLIAPGGSASSPAGTVVSNTDAIDKDATLLSGGGDSGVQSIDPAKLPIDGANGPQYPHAYLKVNTIFEVAHAAGLRTVVMEKHPAYEVAAGPSGKGVDDFYCPEIEAKAAVVDGQLVDSSQAPEGQKLKQISKNGTLAAAYDDLRIAALMRVLDGQDARGTSKPGVPGLVEINLQAYNVAEKEKNGGIAFDNGTETPSDHITEALTHADTAIGQIVDKLKSTGLWDQTLLIVTAKHGQNPRLGILRSVEPSVYLDPLKTAGINVAHATIDDLAVIWLSDPTQAAKAAQILQGVQSGNADAGIDRILWGDSLKAAGLVGYPDRTPDLIVALKPGVVISEKAKRSEHGGFSEDDTHVPIILTGGVIDPKSRDTTVDAPVKTTQIAVTVLEALGLNSGELQGAQIDKTEALPDSGLENPGAAKASAH